MSVRVPFGQIQYLELLHIFAFQHRLNQFILDLAVLDPQMRELWKIRLFEKGFDVVCTAVKSVILDSDIKNQFFQISAAWHSGSPGSPTPEARRR